MSMSDVAWSNRTRTIKGCCLYSLLLILRYSLATAEHKAHWSDMDTGGYTALDFALHDSHLLNANVFMWSLGRVGIYHVLLYIQSR